MFMSCRFPLQPRHVDGVLYVDFYGISTVNSETLTYAPRKAIKSQALVDFVAEWTDSQLPPAQVQSEL